MHESAVNNNVEETPSNFIDVNTEELDKEFMQRM